MDAVLVALGDHQVTIPPPSDFATRVPLSLPRDDDPLAWAALRLLPATLGLVLLLSWLNLRAAEPAAEELTDPTAEVLSWILEPSLAGAPPVGNG